MADEIKKLNGGYDKEFYKTPIYHSWARMKARCQNPKSPDYPRYGGRGIFIDPKWSLFRNFLIDMLPTYNTGLTLERIDNNGHYCKENCKWATRKEQALNTRNVARALRYFFNGEHLTTREWAEKVGIKRTTLDMRLRCYNWPVELALKQ